MKVLLHLGDRIEDYIIQEAVPPPEIPVGFKIFCFVHRADGMPMYRRKERR
jgi:hypothetical protein